MHLLHSMTDFFQFVRDGVWLEILSVGI